MNKLRYILPSAFLTLALGCTPTEKKADVPPPPEAPKQEQAAPAPVPQPNPPAAQTQPESAKQIIQNYAHGLASAPDRARAVQGKIDLGAVSDAVRNFQLENGRYPDSLDAVKSYLRPGTDLSAFNYDPATGSVSLK